MMSDSHDDGEKSNSEEVENLGKIHLTQRE
jgi:hypothetical protein